MFYMATLLSFESNPESSFKMILDIYKELKSEKFWGDTYLPLTASIVYENRGENGLSYMYIKNENNI